MALRAGSEQEWKGFFMSLDIPDGKAKQYATSFHENGMTEAQLSEITKQDLRELGVTLLGHILRIMQKIKEISQAHDIPTSTTQHEAVTTGCKVNAPSPKLPQLSLKMTRPQYRKFQVDWGVFKKITAIPPNQIPSMIYNACDEATQNSIINSIPGFLDLDETDIWKVIEPIVTQHSNPTVHRLSFCNLLQHEQESIQDYVVRLNSSAVDCEYSCPNCEVDMSSVHIKDQLIRGIFNQQLQTDILAKTNHMKTLDDIIKYAEAFEAAVKDQNKLVSESSVARISGGMSRNQTPQPQRSTPNKARKPCSGCGSLQHSSWERSEKCPAWGKRCDKCSILNHYAIVCRKPSSQESVQALMANVVYTSSKRKYTTTSMMYTEEIVATLTPMSPLGVQSRSVKLSIYPDSGASICVAGPQHMKKLRLKRPDLSVCRKRITAVGGFRLHCIGYIMIKFEIGQHCTTQPLYICDNVDRLYFSREGCVATNILSKQFPYPIKRQDDELGAITAKDDTYNPVDSMNDLVLPQRPEMLPYSAEEKNIPKLKQYLLNKFANTAFCRSVPFPVMSGPEAHIHLKPDANPHAKHTPIPVPYHLKEKIKQSLDDDVARGIIAPVPIGTPVQWCSTMVIIPKKNGCYRRTVDLQHLNSQCLRETHHCQSPFQLACQVPANTKKTILDAVDGYHAIALDKESQHLTTFITEWGRYMYLRMPQGFLASGDAYTRRYDELIKDIPRKVKCVDDALLYDSSIEQSFFHTWDYLSLCATNGSVINSYKFEFCQDTVSFAGLKLTPDGIVPSDDILSAIKDFPPSKDLTEARSWMGLVNQTAWAYSTSDIMLPFRELVRSKSKFEWTQSLQETFINCSGGHQNI